MVHPIVPYALRGAIWYQGESNLQDGMLYHEKMKALINGWREVWGQGDFPFYFVQLAPFNYGWGASPLSLPAIWEAQAATLAVPHTGMAVNNGCRQPQGHPSAKQAGSWQTACVMGTCKNLRQRGCNLFRSDLQVDGSGRRHDPTAF